MLWLVSLSWLLLCHGDTLRWTNAGGNPLWEEPRNWDLDRVPTAADDVIINVPNIAGTVQIGATPAAARTLTIGGPSGTLQRLIVYGSLTIGSGAIQPNGNLVLQSSNDRPFTSGPFDGSDRFLFLSGSLSGPGPFKFSNITFSGAAEKQINSSVHVRDLLVDPGEGQAAFISIVGGGLVVDNTLKASQPLSVSTSSSVDCYFNVSGTMTYSPISPLGSGIFKGRIGIGRLEVMSGMLGFAGDVVIEQLDISQGATVTLNEKAHVQKILDVSGEGTLLVPTGSVYLGSTSRINNVSLSGGEINLITDVNVDHFSMTEGLLDSTSNTLKVQNLYMKCGYCKIGASIITAKANLSGFMSFSECDMVMTDRVNLFFGEFQLLEDATLTVASTGAVFNYYSFRIIPLDNHPGKLFVMDGVWSSMGSLDVAVPTSGKGTFKLDGSHVSARNSPIDIGALELRDATFVVIDSTVSVGVMRDFGNGVIQNQGTFITKNLNVTQFIHMYGNAFINSGTTSYLELQLGVFNITGTSGGGPVCSIDNFLFVGGVLAGASLATTVKVNNMTLPGTSPQTFTSLTLSAAVFEIMDQCRVFYQNAKLILGNSSSYLI